jgi:hypothetical protein
MRLLTWLHHQWADLFADFLLPAIAALLPRRWSNSLLWRAARFEPLFPDSGKAIDENEQSCFGTSVDLQRRWAWATLFEAAEAWRLIFGLRPRLTVEGCWPESPGFIAAGMHYGAGISGLWHLREAGLSPQFVFRSVDQGQLPGRQVKLLWYRLRMRLIRRLCPEGPITTGGAARRILDAVETHRSTPVVLFDTPSLEDSDWRLPVGQAEIPLRSGGARLFGEAQARVVFFVVTIDLGTGNTVLSITPLDRERPVAEQIMALMQQTMETDPGQWLLWRGVEGLFRPSAADAPASRCE